MHIIIYRNRLKGALKMNELEELYNYLINNYIQIDWDNSITHFDAVTEQNSF